MADGRVIIEALLDTTNVTRNVANLGRQLNGISWKNLAAGDEKARALAAAFTGVGVAATAKLTLPILAAGAGALKMGSDFEDAMAKVSTIADTTEVPMGDLREAILKLSDDTGIAATDIADNVYNAISAGQKTGDAVAFVGSAAKLAMAGFTDSASALDVLTTTMNAYKLEADQTTRVSDVLLMTQNKGKTTVGELAATMGKAIPTAAAFGVSLENLAAAYATTTASGIDTAESTTYINAMIKELGDTGSDVGKILQDKTGKSFAELMASGMSLGDALNIVAKEGEASNKTMFDMFGSAEAASAAATIASDGASQFAGNLDAMTGAAGATDEAFGKMQTTSYDVDKAINRVKNAAIELGGQLLQALGPAIDAVGGAIEDATKWFSELDADGRNMVITIGLVVAAIGPLLTLIGGLVGKIDRIVSISKSAAGRIGKVGRALDGLAGSAKDAAKASGDYAGKAKDAAKEATAQEGATKKASAAMGLAKGAAVGLALAGIALVIDQVVKYVKKQQDYRKATEGMSDALDAMNQSYLSSRSAAAVADDASKVYVKSVRDVSAEVDDAVKKQADLAESIKQTFSEAGAKVGQLEGYRDTIDELAGRSDLTSQKQAELRTAIDRVNDAANTNYSVVKDAAGAYQIMEDGVKKTKDEILKLIDAQQLQIRLDAINSKIGDLYSGRMDDAKSLSDAQATLNKAQEHYNEVSERTVAGDRAEAAVKKAAKDQLDRAREAYDRANGTYAESVKATKLLTDQQQLLTQAQSKGASSQEKFVASNDYLVAALQGSNKSCLDFASTLQGVGADTTKLGKLSNEQLTKLAQDYNGTYASIAGDLQEFGVRVDDSKVKTQEAFEGIRHSFLLATPEIRTAFVNAGIDADGFAKTLADTGISTQNFNSLTTDQLKQVVEHYDGTVASVQTKLWEFAGATTGPGADAAANWKQGFSASSQGMVDAAVSASGLTLSQFRLLADESGATGEEAVAKLAKSISDQGGEAPEAAKKLIDAVALKMTGGNIDQASRIVGHDVGAGLAQGIDQGADDSKQKALNLANGVIKQAKDALGVHSPSVVFHDIGLNLGQGLANGINEGADLASAAAENLSKLSADHLSSSVVDAWFAGSSLVADGFVPGVASGQGGAAAASDGISKLSADHMSSASTDAWWAGNNMGGTSFADGLNAASPNVAASSDTLSKMSADHMSSASGDAWWAGNNMAGSSFTDGVYGGQSSAASASDYVSKLAADHMSSANGDAWWAGRNMAAGMAQGIRDGSYEVVSAAEVVSSSAVNAAKRALDERSPSRVAKGIGKYFSQGLANGIEEDGRLAAKAAKTVAVASAQALQNFAKGVRSGIPEVESAVSAVAQAAESGFSGIGAKAAGISFKDAAVRYAAPNAMQALAPARARTSRAGVGERGQTTINYSFTGDIIIKCDDVDQVRDMGELARAIMRKGGLR